MAARSSILAGESLGQRSLVGCSPWGHTEPYQTECTHTGFLAAFRVGSGGEGWPLSLEVPDCLYIV